MIGTFLPLVKGDQASQIIWARAAAEEPDKAREVLDYASAKPQFELWSKNFADATMGKSYGNIRAMHDPRHLAGKVEDIVYNDDTKSIDVMVKVLDPVDWAKVEAGGYTGLSIGGGYVRKWPCPLHKGHTRYTPRISEISLVDSPCIPSARFLELTKRDGSVDEIALVGHARTFAEMRPPPSFNARLAKGFVSVTRDVVGRVIAHPATKLAQHGFKAAKTVKDVAQMGALALGVAGVAGGSGGLYAAHKHRQKRPRLAMPRYMAKGAVADSPISGAINERMEKLLIPAALAVGGAYAGGKAVATLARPMLRGAMVRALQSKAPEVAGRRMLRTAEGALGASAAASVAGGAMGWHAGRRIQRRKADPSSMAAPSYMKSEDAIADAIGERLAKWVGPLPVVSSYIPRTPGHSTHYKPAVRRRGAGPSTYNSPKQANPGLALPVYMKSEDGIADAIGQRLAKGLSPMASELSEKEHAQRIAAAKARWLGEGHHDLDTAFDARAKQASKATLGRGNKVAAIEHQRHAAWSAIADTHAAYDKLRPHLPAHASLMMEVPHQAGLLHNPEAVGEDHFGHDGKPKRDLHILHPDEVDDWIAKHGEQAKTVSKAEPTSRIPAIGTLGAITRHPGGRFAAIEAA